MKDKEIEGQTADGEPIRSPEAEINFLRAQLAAAKAVIVSERSPEWADQAIAHDLSAARADAAESRLEKLTADFDVINTRLKEARRVRDKARAGLEEAQRLEGGCKTALREAVRCRDSLTGQLADVVDERDKARAGLEEALEWSEQQKIDYRAEHKSLRNALTQAHSHAAAQTIVVHELVEALAARNEEFHYIATKYDTGFSCDVEDMVQSATALAIALAPTGDDDGE